VFAVPRLNGSWARGGAGSPGFSISDKIGTSCGAQPRDNLPGRIAVGRVTAKLWAATTIMHAANY